MHHTDWTGALLLGPVPGCEEIAAAVLLLSLYKQFLLLQTDHDNRSINLSGQDASQEGHRGRIAITRRGSYCPALLAAAAAPPPPFLLLLRRRRLNGCPAIETRRSLGTIINGEINFGAFSQFQ